MFQEVAEAHLVNTTRGSCYPSSVVSEPPGRSSRPILVGECLAQAGATPGSATGRRGDGEAMSRHRFPPLHIAQPRGSVQRGTAPLAAPIPAVACVTLTRQDLGCETDTERSRRQRK